MSEAQAAVETTQETPAAPAAEAAKQTAEEKKQAFFEQKAKERAEKRLMGREERLRRAQELASGKGKTPVGGDPSEQRGDLAGDKPSEPKEEPAAAKADAAEPAESDKPVEAEADKPADEPVDDAEVVALAKELQQEFKDNPDARQMFKKLAKQGVAGTFVELKKWTQRLNGREAALNAGQGQLGREREALEQHAAKLRDELAEWNELKTKNPREFARRIGLTLRHFADEAALQDEPEEKRELRTLKEQREADAKARAEAEEKHAKELEALKARLDSQEKERIHREEMAWVSDEWNAAKSDFPYLVAYGDSQIIESAHKYLREDFEANRQLDRRETFRRMNSWAESQKLEGNWTEAQLKRFAQANPGAVAKAAQSERANGPAKTANPAAPKAAPTISNADSSERVAPPRKPGRADRLERALSRFAGN